MRQVLVCGSRSWDSPHTILLVLKLLKHPCTVIHGGAKGADELAGVAAKRLGFKVVEVKADWDTHGKSAGFKRNIEMLEMKPNAVIAFYDGVSKGTAHTIKEARRRNIPVMVVTP